MAIFEMTGANPYMEFTPEQLEAEITELACEVLDWQQRGDITHAEIADQHRVLATQALLNLAGVWS